MELGSPVQRKALWVTWLVLFLFALITPVSAVTYTYDDLGRLTSVSTTSGPSCSYTYDAGGNILSVTNQASLAVVSSNPQNQAVNVPVDQTIEIHFNKNIEQDANFAGINLMTGQDSISIADSVYAETLIVNPVNNLLESSVYDLNVPAAAVKMASGTESNAVITIQFTTVAPGLNMIASDPANNATGVPANQTITVTFNQDIQAGDNYANISLSAGGQTVASSNSMAGSVLTLDPTSDLSENQAYTLLIPAGALKTASGVLSNNEITIQFNTAAPGLNMTSSDPVNNATGVPVNQSITVTFNQDIQAGDNYANISLTSGGQTLATNNSMSSGVFSADPTSDLTENQSYTLLIPAGALKTASGTLNSEVSVQFTTVAPVLNMTASDPANNDTGVPVSQTITVTFNQNIQAGDNYAGISLTCGGQPVTTTNDVAGSVLTVDPANDLTGNTTCVLSIPANALKNMDSSSSNSQINIQFITP